MFYVQPYNIKTKWHRLKIWVHAVILIIWFAPISSKLITSFYPQVSLGLGGLNVLPLNVDLHSTDTNSSFGSPKARRRRFTAAAPSVTPPPPPIRIADSFDSLDTMDDCDEANEVVSLMVDKAEIETGTILVIPIANLRWPQTNKNNL